MPSSHSIGRRPFPTRGPGGSTASSPANGLLPRWLQAVYRGPHRAITRVFANPAAPFAATVALLGAAVLAGWLLGLPGLQRRLPGWVAMQPQTALAFLIAGLALYAFSRDWLRTARVAILLLLPIPVSALLQTVSGYSLGVDTLLFPDAVLHQGWRSFPGRPAPLGCIEFLIFCLFIALPRRTSRFRWAPCAVANLGLLAASVALAGHILDVHELTALGTPPGMAIHATVAFVFLFAGALLADRQTNWLQRLFSPSPGARMARSLLPYILGWPVAVGLVIHLTDRVMEDAHFQLAVAVVILTVLLLEAVMRFARRLDVAEFERQRANDALLKANEELEQRIAERTAELLRSNEALARSNQELQEFAYIAAHDLQTPFRSISGFVQLLRKEYQGRFDPQADAWIEQVVDSTQRMHAMIRDVLAYSRVETQGRPLKPVAFNRLFDDVVAMMADTIRELGALVTRDDLPEVLGDPTQLGQVAQNLLDNALKYHGGNPPRVHMAASRRGDEWIFSVADNGIGIAEKHQDRIFEIFRRLHTQHAYAGTGIGLSVCRRVIHRHGGRIWVESEPGKGSTFYFTLPAGNGESRHPTN